MDFPVYHGFEIYTYRGTISDKKRFVSDLRKYFSNEGWFFDGNSDIIEILHKSTNFTIEVVFKATKPNNEAGIEDLKKYGSILKSDFIGFRDRDEERHKELYEDVLRRLRWEKVGYWLEGGERILKSRIKRARLKK